MRKVTRLTVGAFENGKEICLDNTRSTGDTLVLHGNSIAKREDGKLYIRTAGYNSRTTRERLNGLNGVSVWVHKGVLYLNDKVWENPEQWTLISA